MRRAFHLVALAWLLLISLAVARQSRTWEPYLWVGDLGNLPYQCMRMAGGETLYRDFVGKNPLGVFLTPWLVFKVWGATMDGLVVATVVQFGALLLATYQLAFRMAPKWGWLIFPLSIPGCLGSCGLIHHPWAGAVGLVVLPLLYQQVYARERPRWWLAGLLLAWVGLFHQLLLASLSLALVLYTVAYPPGTARAAARGVLECAGVASISILGVYGAAGILNGTGWAYIPLALESTHKFMLTHQSMAVNNPLFFSDLLNFQPLVPGPGGWIHRLLEVLQRGLGYFGFPLLGLACLVERRWRESDQGGFLSWLLLAGSLSCLAAYPQFSFAHMRAFFLPLSFTLVCYWLEQHRSQALALVVACVCLLSLEELAVVLGRAHVSVTFPAGQVYVNSQVEAREWQRIADQVSGSSGQALLVYPYFPMAYFLFEQRNLFRIHEMYPSRLLFTTGFDVDHEFYREGMQKLRRNPPPFALQAAGAQRLFLNVERLEQRPDPGSPLLDFLNENYQAVDELRFDDGSACVVLKRYRGAGEPHFRGSK